MKSGGSKGQNFAMCWRVCYQQRYPGYLLSLRDLPKKRKKLFCDANLTGVFSRGFNKDCQLTIDKYSLSTKECHIKVLMKKAKFSWISIWENESLHLRQTDFLEPGVLIRTDTVLMASSNPHECIIELHCTSLSLDSHIVHTLLTKVIKVMSLRYKR